ncbi:MAG: hypothetical protein ACRC4M_05150 [Mycoplasma sp.]
MKKSKLIKWEILEDIIIEESVKDFKSVKLSSENINNTIEFHILNNIFDFSFQGLKIIKTINTNKFIRLIFDDKGESKLKINNNKIKSKKIIIISPLTRISDILDTKTSGVVANYLKINGGLEDKSEIEKSIEERFKTKSESFQNIIDINLTKASLLPFLDVNENFVDELNIIDILNILKNDEERKLIIFNDVEYLKIKNIEKWNKWFDFLYITNSYENNYETMYGEFMLVENCGNLVELEINNILN